MERFTVLTTLDYFVGWLNSYGLAHQYDFPRKSGTRGVLNGTNLQILYHHVRTMHGVIGYISFDILTNDAENLTVAARPVAQVNAIGRLTPGVDNPHREELERYFFVLAQAIRRKWMEAEQPKIARVPDKLSPREQEVAVLLAMGMNDNDIAERLVISARTSKSHRQSISNKWNMDTEDIGKMMFEAIRRGYRGD